MKKIIGAFLIGLGIGLLIATIVYSYEYQVLSNKYNNAIDLLRLYKNYVEANNGR